MGKFSKDSRKVNGQYTNDFFKHLAQNKDEYTISDNGSIGLNLQNGKVIKEIIERSQELAKRQR